MSSTGSNLKRRRHLIGADDIEENEDKSEELESEIEIIGSGNDAADNTGRDAENKDKKPRKKRSKMWNHFESYYDPNSGIEMATCNYCKKSVCADSQHNGTAGLNNHFRRCKLNPENLEKKAKESQGGLDKFVHAVAPGSEEGEGHREMSTVWKFNQEAARDALSQYIVISELPFSHCEDPGFIHFCSVVCPQFLIPSRATTTRDILKLYVLEKNMLKNYFQKSGVRLSFTTDTWTSCQNATYMSLTAHFVDEDWTLQKRILNFIPCPEHKGDDIGALLEKCLNEWEIEKVFTITVDNASTNDVAISFLKDRFIDSGNALLGGDYMHVRCVAHIINLVVRDGLKEVKESVERVRKVVRWVKHSPVRTKRFSDLVKEEGIKCKKLLCLDVATRWNFVYLLLDTALNFQEVFDKYAKSDVSFRDDFSKDGPYPIGLPNDKDWRAVQRIVVTLKHFYDLTLRVSGTSYVTSHTFLDEISDIDDLLKSWILGKDDYLSGMASRMKLKFDKYWGFQGKNNPMMFIAVILDPRKKFETVEFTLSAMYGEENGPVMANEVKELLVRLFEQYQEAHELKLPPPSSTSACSSSSGTSGNSNSNLNKTKSGAEKKKQSVPVPKSSTYLKMLSLKKQKKENELERYLSEAILLLDNPTDYMDVLEWWKVRVPVYPVLSALARDVFAMPISTVASESAFSTGGRVIDEYRASLTPKSAQALVCTQDWILQKKKKASKSRLSMQEDYEFLHSIEQEVGSVLANSLIG